MKQNIKKNKNKNKKNKTKNNKTTAYTQTHIYEPTHVFYAIKTINIPKHKRPNKFYFLIIFLS